MEIGWIRLYLAAQMFLKKHLCWLSRLARYSLKLDGFYYSDYFKCNVLMLHMVRKSIVIEVQLHELSSRMYLLKYLCPFDLALTLLLANDRKVRAMLMKQVKSLPALKDFHGIDSQFYSERTQTHMVVVTVPDTDKQICLSAEELVNDASLMHRLRKANRSYGRQEKIVLNHAAV